jgi:hypothetical protein
MKWMIGLLSLAALLLTGGCAVESGYGYGYGGAVYGEYPYTYYGSTVYPGYYPYYRHWHPYDRDHYWDRHHWERRRWHHERDWH